MKRIILLSLSFVFAATMFAQQDAQYTQFMFNKLAYNPGYAGSYETTCITCLYRTQWVGIEGAPTSVTLGAHAPLMNKRVGIGMNLAYDDIGFTRRINASLAYSYRIKMGQGALAIGVQGTLETLRVDWDEADPTQLFDNSIPVGSPNKFAPNFGAGLYYDSDRFYVGLSVPHILDTDIDFASSAATAGIISREERHYYLMGGVVVDLGQKVRMKPAVLLKYVQDAPFDADVNLSFLFYDRVWLGATYRLGGSTQKGFGESIDAVLQLYLTQQLKLGVAYDFTLSELSDYSDGTFEVSLDYCFKYKKAKLINPRFF